MYIVLDQRSHVRAGERPALTIAGRHEDGAVIMLMDGDIGVNVKAGDGLIARGPLAAEGLRASRHREDLKRANARLSTCGGSHSPGA